MREFVDADSASLPAARTGGDAPQQSEIVSRDYCACSSKVETPPPRKTGPEARRGEMLGEHTRVCKSDDGEVENKGKNLSRKHVDKELSERRRAFARNKATGEAGGEAGRPHETQGCQGEVSVGGVHLRHVQRSYSSGQRR